MRVDWDPPPVLLLRITFDELEPFVLSAPGMLPPERPVDVRMPLAFPPLTFLMELFRLPLPCRFCYVKIMFEIESAVMEPLVCCLTT